jgi:hypothetical protein
MALAAFLVQSHPASATLRVVVLDPHFDDGTDPPEGINHCCNDRPIAKTDDIRVVDRIQQRARFLLGQNWRFAFLNRVLRASDRRGRIRGHDLADHQPIEQHADGGEMLLDRGLGESSTEQFDVRRDVDRFNVDKVFQIISPAPAGELPNTAKVCPSGIRIADIGGKELEESPGGRRRWSKNARNLRQNRAGKGFLTNCG